MSGKRELPKKLITKLKELERVLLIFTYEPIYNHIKKQSCRVYQLVLQSINHIAD